MLNVTDGFKQAFLADNARKDIDIVFEGTDFSKVNFNELMVNGSRHVSGDAQYSFPIAWITNDLVGTPSENLIFNYTEYAKEIGVFGYFKLSNFTTTLSPAPPYLWIGAEFNKVGQQPIYRETVLSRQELENGFDFSALFNYDNDNLEHIYLVGVRFLDENRRNYPANRGTVTFDCEFSGVHMDLATSRNLLPYSVSEQVQVQKLGLNPDDYITISEETLEPLTTTDLIKESFRLTESLCSQNTIKFGSCEAAECEFDIADNEINPNRQYFKAYVSVQGVNERVPLGRFRITSVKDKNVHGLVTKHIEAYDGVLPLNVDATNWFTSRMGIINLDNYTGIGAQYARQMFESLYSICKYLGVKLNIEEINTGYLSGMITATPKYRFAGEDTAYLEYVTQTYQVDPDYLYRINYPMAAELKAWFKDVDYAADAFGISSENGGILVTEVDANMNQISNICVDSDNFFALHSNCKYIAVLIPKRFVVPHTQKEITGTPTLTKGRPNFNFTSANFPVRLVYYNYKTKEIPIPTVTARDIIRSLVEITGAFFRFGRNGQIEFIKPSEAALYPSNTLYPADDLYPSGASYDLIPNTKYESFKYDDYVVANFGKVQIKLNSTSANESITKNYEGNGTKPNTYVIDDNVFYCNTGIVYDTYTTDGGNTWIEPLPEAVEMLQNFYASINGVRYTPHETITPAMPWIECGDRLTILTNDGGIESFVFRRNLEGIQIMKDTYEAYGEEINNDVADFGVFDWKL